MRPEFRTCFSALSEFVSPGHMALQPATFYRAHPEVSAAKRRSAWLREPLTKIAQSVCHWRSAEMGRSTEDLIKITVAVVLLDGTCTL